MNEPNSKSEKPNPHRFSQEQYEMLKHCSDKKDMTEWNEWRKAHPDEDIWLVEGDFSGWYMEKVDFSQGRYTIKSPTEKQIALNNEVHLEGSIFEWANLKNGNFSGANMNDTKFWSANAEGAAFGYTSLIRAKLGVANFENCDFLYAILENASFTPSQLKGAKFTNADLRGCSMRVCVIDGSTRFWNCKINRYSKGKRFTDFTGTALDNVLVTVGQKELLEYNIRRQSWEVWYDDENEPIRDGVYIFSNKKIRLKTNKIITWLVRKFWQISDYGISTKQIIWTFFKWAVIFAVVYLAWGLIDYHIVGNKDYPGIVSNLFVLEDSKQLVSGWLVPLRSVYFSIVTMTTLGFGDMYANAHSLIRGIFGHILLALQVILGYVLLGALVTRFAVLFTAGGPAGKFADEKER